MAEVVTIDELAKNKERGVGCRGILKAELDTVANIESIVIVSLNKDNQINVSYSRNSSLETLGMLEVGKAILLEEMQ
ncbi:TPA: hypothetical protein U1X79_001218 [Streptococcus suis]|uniref:hypothetical protein n=1 Tax=Streptococcus suis TaxID=1307 RepID=UPI00040DD087|nr:hypothetical protein [Streptococcus suis]MBO4130957.1 hypothetical protein [Streptococcus suis]MBO4133687.1 hypothetical protein [Streptococcus suis]NQK13250.1 hypothetical protein [Streptococcus suis]NQM24344.1 hypothetical protein [Streptococcus suis]HEL2028506.1 hypothetical protein [Streptococcus suis]